MVEEKITRENVAEHMIRYQLKMVGKTWEDALADQQWYKNFTMTPQQHEEFKAYCIPLIKKVFRCNKKKAEATFSWFDLEFGLRVAEPVKESKIKKFIKKLFYGSM